MFGVLAKRPGQGDAVGDVQPSVTDDDRLEGAEVGKMSPDSQR